VPPEGIKIHSKINLKHGVGLKSPSLPLISRDCVGNDGGQGIWLGKP